MLAKVGKNMYPWSPKLREVKGSGKVVILSIKWVKKTEENGQ